MIKFGTDGWRGIIADDFTFANVRLASQAVCDYLLSEARTPEPTLVIGYDTRFLSDRFAGEAACVAAGNGIKVLLTDSFAPTPAVSYAVLDHNADGAIMFTASHNPYRYNGLKFKAPYGGSATPAITDEIERHLEENNAGGRQAEYQSYDEAVASGAIHLFDPKAPYLKRLSELVDTSIIKKNGRGAVIDPMFGAGRGYLSEFLSAAGSEVLEINNKPDPYFGGGQPEPLGQHLTDLTKEVKGVWPLGVALDGDADRVGAVDSNGAFINSHQIFSLLLRYLVKEKGLRGEVVKTVSTTRMIDLLAAEYGLILHETPIGFKYICDYMLRGNILIGGEESGGIGVIGHIPERDGMLMGALLVEMVNFYGKTLAELWGELETEFGRFCYDRVDIEVGRGIGASVAAFLTENRPKEIALESVSRIDDRDGFKFHLSDGSWLMIRPSGTENVIRIYAEADSPGNVKKLLREGKALIAEAQENPDARRG